MTCQKCGAPLTAAEKSCPKCGTAAIPEANTPEAKQGREEGADAPSSEGAEAGVKAEPPARSGGKKKFSMSAEWATAIGTWVTIIFLGISTYFIWVQLGELRTSVQNQTYQSVYETEFELHKYFLEPDNAKYRKYFYGGADIGPEVADDDPEKIKVDTLAEWWCDFFDDVYQQEKTMRTDTFDRWRQFMKDIYQTSPPLQRFIAKRGDRWYPKDFVIDIKCPTLDKNQCRPQ